MHRIWSVKEGHGLVLVPDVRVYFSIHLEAATKRIETFFM